MDCDTGLLFQLVLAWLADVQNGWFRLHAALGPVSVIAVKAARVSPTSSQFHHLSAPQK